MQKPIAPQAIETIAKIVDLLPINDDVLSVSILALSFQEYCKTLNMSKDETIAAFTAIVEVGELGKKAKAPLAN